MTDETNEGLKARAGYCQLCGNGGCDLCFEPSDQAWAILRRATTRPIEYLNDPMTAIQAARAVEIALSRTPSPDTGLVERRFRHKKRGTTYTLIGVGKAQGTLTDEDSVVLYRGDDGGLWARHQAEFSDGRFEEVASLQPNKADKERLVERVKQAIYGDGGCTPYAQISPAMHTKLDKQARAVLASLQPDNTASKQST